jgi:D-proline reductase (dithiol) PrdB
VASFETLAARHRLTLALYRWRTVAPPSPWVRLARPLSESRVALVTSAALLRPGVDAPFERRRGGDTSFRLLPDDLALGDLVLGQTSDAFDHAPVANDANLAFPRDRLRELVAAGVVGSAAPRHVSFNGSITAPLRLVRETAPLVADVLRADAVDAALFVPV